MTPAEAKARELDETERLARAGRTVPEIAAAQRITQPCVRARLRYRRIVARSAIPPRTSPLHEYTALARLATLAKLLRAGEPVSCVTAAVALDTCARTISRDLDFLRGLGWRIRWDVPARTFVLRHAPAPTLL